MVCPVCAAPLKPYDLVRKHIAACRAIAEGLVAKDLAIRTVTKKPLGYKWDDIMPRRA